MLIAEKEQWSWFFTHVWVNNVALFDWETSKSLGTIVNIVPIQVELMEFLQFSLTTVDVTGGIE